MMSMVKNLFNLTKSICQKKPMKYLGKNLHSSSKAKDPDSFDNTSIQIEEKSNDDPLIAMIIKELGGEELST